MRVQAPETLEKGRVLSGPWATTPEWGLSGVFILQAPSGAKLHIGGHTGDGNTVAVDSSGERHVISAAPAGPLDPAFGLIAAHRAAAAAHLVALEEQARLEEIGDLGADEIAEGPCHAEMAAFNDLIETAPVTFAGLVAWSSYLDEIEPWMFEEKEGRRWS